MRLWCKSRMPIPCECRVSNVFMRIADGATRRRRSFLARVMATVVRHMRVRATITDADMRLILSYMTE